MYSALFAFVAPAEAGELAVSLEEDLPEQHLGTSGSPF